MTFLTRTSLTNRLIVGLLTLAIAVLGLFAMNNLKQELMPPMDFPMAFVSVQVDGVAPEEMVRTATEPAETALESISGVSQVTSSTSTGNAELTVEWPFENDSDETLSAIRTAVEGVEATLPSNAEVEVMTGNTDDMPAMQLSVSTTGDEEELADEVAQTVVPALQGLSGVQEATLMGSEEQQVMIDLRPDDVEELGVDPAQIAPLLESHGAAVPAGQAGSDEGSISVTVGSALDTVEDIEALPLTTEDDVVAISEFADVHLEAAPADSITRVNGNPALMLIIMPSSDANVIEISHAVNAELDRLGPGLDAEFVTLFDQAPYIEQSIHDLSVEGGLGLLFAVLVILAFLASWRSTMIAALSIPLSLLITMVGLWWSDNTLNMLTLGALTIAIGRVVDDSIVVIENITRRWTNGPLTPEAVVASVRQVAAAITASTLTAVAVFLPIAFVSGMAGQLFRPFAVTSSIALIASLVVALTIVPVFAYWFLRNRRPSGKGAAAEADHSNPGLTPETETAEGAASPAAHAGAPTRALDHIANGHAPAAAGQNQDRERTAVLPQAAAPTAAAEATTARIATAQAAAEQPSRSDPGEGSDLHEIHTAHDRLQRRLMPALHATRRHPVITLITSGTILVATLVMAVWLPTDFLGSSGAETLRVEHTLPEDAEDDAAASDDTDADGDAAGNVDRITAVEPVEQTLSEVPGVEDVLSTIPVGSRATAEEETVHYDLMLNEGVDALTVEVAVQENLDGLRGSGEFQLLTQDAQLGGAGSDIALQIRGSDPDALQEASDMLEEQLGEADGVQSVSSDLTGEQPVARVALDDVRAAELGFDRAMVSRAIQEALEGAPAGQLTLDGQDRAIVVRTPGAERTADKLGEILLPVTMQQNAEEQQNAADELQEEAEEQEEQQRIEAENELQQQLGEAASQRGELTSELSHLREQLDALQDAPVVPEPPRSPEEDAAARAHEERAEQLQALQGAIASAESGIESIDEQVEQLRESQAEAEEQYAEQQRAEEEQEAAADARATPLKLSAIAEVTEELTAPTIDRADGERQVTLSVAPASGQLQQANLAVTAAIDSTELPAGVTFDVGGVSAEQDEAFAQMGAAMLAAIVLVVLVMVATFRGFRQPLVLLVSIPFAATGAILGLLITNTPLGLPALIGLLMLIGIVVTNAIVLMDLINRLRASGASLEDAVSHGTRLRLRPILMTAAATIFALIPMSLGLTGGGVFISQPLAIVVIGGLVSSTVLTLVLVPILYTLVERRKERGRMKRARRAAKRRIKRGTRHEMREVQRALKTGGGA